MSNVDLDSPSTSMAISCMWAWLIPHFYIEFTEFRLALERVTSSTQIWNDKGGEGTANNNNNSSRRSNNNYNNTPPPPSRHDANMATVRGVCWAIVTITCVYISSAIVVCALTKQNFNTETTSTVTKMHAIIIGIGRMLSACLLAYFSTEFPRWLGLTYSSQRHVEYYKQIVSEEEEVGEDDNNDDSAKEAENEEVFSDNSIATNSINIFEESSKQYKRKKEKTRIVVVAMRELAFRVCWSIMGHFFVMYPFLLMYFCNVTPATVFTSTFIGIFFGFTLVYLIWLSHTLCDYHKRSIVAIAISLLIALAASVAFSAGCWYVKEVWHNNKSYSKENAAFTFFVWLLLIGAAHFTFYKQTQRKLVETVIANGAVANANNTSVASDDDRAAAAGSLRCARSVRRKYSDDDIDSICFTVGGTSESNYSCNDISMKRDEIKKIKGEWRYGQSDVFQPPKSMNSVTKELSQAVMSPRVKKPFSSFLSTFKKKKKNDDDEEKEEVDDDDHGDGGGLAPTNLNFDNNLDDAGLINVDSFVHDRDVARRSSTAGEVIVCTRTRNDSMDGTSRTFPSIESDTSHDDDDNGIELQPTAVAIGSTSDSAEIVAINNDDSLDDSEHEERRSSDSDVAANYIDDDYDECNDINAVPSDVEIIIHHNNEQDNKKLLTVWHMMKANSCCKRRKHYNAPRRKGCGRLSIIFKWSLWMIVAIVHVSFTIVTIGATQQQNTVREALNPTFELLYPDNYNTGPMCAWKKIPTYNIDADIVDYRNSDIRTFNSLQAVYDANYTVVHCGECGHCSNWNDLKLQWTTRTYLAESARECGTKSLFGTIEDVHDCNHNDIGFTDECAMCWTVDELCCKENCFWIFLQSVFTNSLSNFQVDLNAEITTAACDEAICGPEFVPCSGATRRRMNIVSTIERPLSQQCTVVNEDWAVIFNHP